MARIVTEATLFNAAKEGLLHTQVPEKMLQCKRNYMGKASMWNVGNYCMCLRCALSRVKIKLPNFAKFWTVAVLRQNWTPIEIGHMGQFLTSELDQGVHF